MKDECLICKAPLVYLKADEEMESNAEKEDIEKVEEIREQLRDDSSHLADEASSERPHKNSKTNSNKEKGEE